MEKMKLIYRTIIAVLLLPLVVAGIVPVVLIVIDPWRQPVFFPALIVLFGGLTIASVCIKDFYKHGSGTLAPWDAPQSLVVTGLYRYCRNPMYFGILLLIAGLALLFTSPLVLIYNIAAAAAFHLRVIKFEEPELKRLFGQRWVIYSAMTNRWLPKLR